MMSATPCAVVTGGTRGIGRAVAMELAACGFRVVALARSSRLDLGDEPFETVECDLTDRQAIADVFAALGPVGVLVNNAGMSTSAKVEATTLDDWDRNLALNATAPLLCIQAVLASMRHLDAGRIITVASTASLEGAPYVAAYTASKHAVLGLMRVLAEELRGSGIGVASVCPTFVRTEMTEATIANIAARTHVSIDAATQRLARLTPHGRLVEPAEVASAVALLVQQPVAEIHGRIVVVDGAPNDDQ